MRHLLIDVHPPAMALGVSADVGGRAGTYPVRKSRRNSEHPLPRTRPTLQQGQRRRTKQEPPVSRL